MRSTNFLTKWKFTKKQSEKRKKIPFLGKMKSNFKKKLKNDSQDENRLYFLDWPKSKTKNEKISSEKW